LCRPSIRWRISCQSLCNQGFGHPCLLSCLPAALFFWFLFRRFGNLSVPNAFSFLPARESFHIWSGHSSFFFLAFMLFRFPCSETLDVSCVASSFPYTSSGPGKDMSHFLSYFIDTFFFVTDLSLVTAHSSSVTPYCRWPDEYRFSTRDPGFFPSRLLKITASPSNQSCSQICRFFPSFSLSLHAAVTTDASRPDSFPLS